ncbi:hypothetical protein [Sphingobium sp. HWE2-09]|nr:hypothetical protein [Sphingobium sp. HWE2-09]
MRLTRSEEMDNGAILFPQEYDVDFYTSRYVHQRPRFTAGADDVPGRRNG